MTSPRLSLPRPALAALVLAWTPLCHAQLAVISPTYVDFGEVKMGAIADVSVSVRNLTTRPLTLAGGGLIGGASSSFSSGGATGDCQPIPAEGTCTILYRFQPRSDHETFSDRTAIGVGTGDNYQEQRIDFRGTGGEALAQVTPRGIDFGEDQVGVFRVHLVTITNTHSAPLTVAAGAAIGAFTTAGGNCPASLAPGDSCDIAYGFAPASAGNAQGNATIQVSASGQPPLSQSFGIQLSGRGLTSPPLGVIAPVVLDFGAIKLGTEILHPGLFTNRTNATVTASYTPFLQGSDHNLFSTGPWPTPQTGCSEDPNSPRTIIEAGRICPRGITFRPRERRVHQASSSARIQIENNPDVVQTVTFTGTGVGRLARLSPAEVDFGDLPAGEWAQVFVRFDNTSGGPLTNLLGGGISANFFSRVTSSCTTTMATGASCGFTYRFMPLVAGNFQATILLSYQSPAAGMGEISQIVLSGTSGTAIFINGFD